MRRGAALHGSRPAEPRLCAAPVLPLSPQGYPGTQPRDKLLPAAPAGLGVPRAGWVARGTDSLLRFDIAGEKRHQSGCECCGGSAQAAARRSLSFHLAAAFAASRAPRGAGS